MQSTSLGDCGEFTSYMRRIEVALQNLNPSLSLPLCPHVPLVNAKRKQPQHLETYNLNYRLYMLLLCNKKLHFAFLVDSNAVLHFAAFVGKD